jgi:NAD(P)-dependent dehydrogenase (short-subunit alcohol dehydrogenase family)
MSRLEGTVAIVTGAGRGAGRAEALKLAADGAADEVWTYEALDKARSALFPD